MHWSGIRENGGEPTCVQSHMASVFVRPCPAVTLSLPDEISLLGVDLAIQLEQVAFSVANRQLPR